MRRLVASMRALSEACQRRGADQSPQGKYTEARLNSRGALRKGHNPALDGFPQLVEIAREHSSREVAEYVQAEVGLPIDNYLDAIQMIARDRCNPIEVANPAARVRTALKRQCDRHQREDRERWLPLPEDQAKEWKHSASHEAESNSNIDFERGKNAVHLTDDQTRALEARMDGLNLQSSEAKHELEWEPARVEAVRRSLEPGRRSGRMLRQHFAAYKGQR
jgi:hypothetical protein